MENVDNINYIKNTIVKLLGEFFKSGAKEKWESFKDDDGNIHIKIDGKE